jgi:hypothetical protein
MAVGLRWFDTHRPGTGGDLDRRTCVKRNIIVVLALLVVAVPLAASQFVELPFDQVARESTYIVRGSVVNTWTAWDDSHEIIFTYATVRVSRYFGDATGPDTLVVREVGGTVDGYTQDAIGFPAIRENEQVVLFLAPWDDGSEYRIHAYNQGKFLVRNRAGIDILIADPVKQGEGRLISTDKSGRTLNDDAAGLPIDEFAQMVDSARAGAAVPVLDVVNAQ